MLCTVLHLYAKQITDISVDHVRGATSPPRFSDFSHRKSRARMTPLRLAGTEQSWLFKHEEIDDDCLQMKREAT